MPQPQLKLAQNKSAYERAMDEIDAAWRDWHGPTGQPWKPYDGETTPWSGNVSKSLDKGRYIVVSEPEIPLWRKILRRLKR